MSRILTAACAALLLVFDLAAIAATSEPIGLEAGIEAKTSRERARQAAQRGAREQEQRRREDAECGSLDIGNVTAGGSGFNRVPREITVVVQGDVVNANNRCR